MNLVFNSDNRVAHTELKEILDDNKIKYTELDSDAFKIGFKIPKADAQDFQMNLANITAGRCPGSFYTEN